jgi:hypothetical protein
MKYGDCAPESTSHASQMAESDAKAETVFRRSVSVEFRTLG